MANLFHIGKKFWFRVDKPTNLKEYEGRFCLVKTDGGVNKLVEIKRVVGSFVHQTKLEIDTEKDGQFVISALDFFAQMNGEKISKEEIEAFDDTTLEITGGPKRPRLRFSEAPMWEKIKTLPTKWVKE